MARATVSRGTAVLSRTEPMTDSIVSAAWTVQSGDEADDAGEGEAWDTAVGHYPRGPVRQLLAVVAGAAVAALGALIIGEYEMAGSIALIAGVVYALALAETMTAVAGEPHPALLLVVSALAGAGFAWGLWISTGRDLDFATTEGWAAVSIATGSAPWWLRSASRRGQSSSPDSARTADGPST